MNLGSIERALRDIAPVVNEWYRRVLFLPPQASAMARRIDALHYVEITFFTFVAVAFMGATVFFIVHYRRRGEPRDGDSCRNARKPCLRDERRGWLQHPRPHRLTSEQILTGIV